MQRLRDRWSALWAGTVSATPLALFRVGLALVVLVRTTNVLSPWLDLDHHAWVDRLEYLPAVERVEPPALASPLLPLPRPGEQLATLLVWARTGLAILLLVGVRSRVTAALLALVGGGLMCVDRYRYLHHLYLLWVSCAWLALAPSGDRLSVERWRGAQVPTVPRWPLQLLRAQALVAYGAAGLAKLDPDWLSGRTLAFFAGRGFVEGALWSAASRACGTATVATALCGLELCLVALLAIRRTRWIGVAAGLLLHAAMSSVMMLSTFGVEMGLYLMLFLPWPEDRISPTHHASPTAAPRDATEQGAAE